MDTIKSLQLDYRTGWSKRGKTKRRIMRLINALPDEKARQKAIARLHKFLWAFKRQHKQALRRGKT